MSIFAEIGAYIHIAKMCFSCPENTLQGEEPHICENVQYDADTGTIFCGRPKAESKESGSNVVW